MSGGAGSELAKTWRTGRYCTIKESGASPFVPAYPGFPSLALSSSPPGSREGPRMNVQDAIAQFLFHCQYEKNLSPKTLKAYSIDLRQFRVFIAAELGVTELGGIEKVVLRAYIKSLFGDLAEKSVKR